MKRYVAMVLFVCQCVASFAQDCSLTLRGSVLDEHDGSILDLANVQIMGTSLGAVTDSLGHYQIEGICAGRWIVTCSHLGCETIVDTIDIQANTVHHFYPEHHAEELKAFTISSNQEARLSSMKVRHSANPEDGIAINLGDLAEQVIGVRSLSTGASISKPMVRGMHSNRLLIINEGVRQEGQQWGTEHAPEIDASLAGDIEVIKGAQSVRYGTDAIGGVLIVNAPDYIDSAGIDGIWKTGWQSNGHFASSALGLNGRSKRFEQFAWRAQGSVKKGGNQRSADYWLNNTGLEEGNFSGSVQLANDKRGLEIAYSQFNTNVGIFSGSHIGNLTDLYAAFERAEPVGDKSFTYEIGAPYQHIEHEMIRVNGFYRWNQKSQIKLQYGRQYNLRREYDNHNSSAEKPALEFQIVTHTLDAVWDRQIQASHSFEVGLSGMQQGNSTAGRFFIPNFHKYTGGLFGLWKWYASENALLEVGSRFDMVQQYIYMYEEGVSKTYDHSFRQPSLSISYQWVLGKHVATQTNLATAWRPPNVSELYSYGLHHGSASFEIGNRNLNAEVAYSLEEVLVLEMKNFRLQAEGFVNYFENYIALIPTFPATLTIRGAFPTFEYIPVNALFYGSDIEATYSIIENLDINSRISLLRARNIENGKWLNQIPADQSSLSIQYARIKWFQASVSGVWTNKQWRIPPSSEYVNPPDGYFLMNLSLGARKEWSKKELRFDVEINNLFNTNYRDYLNRYRYYADDLGRNIGVNLTFKF